MLPLGERVALSGRLTRDTWLRHPAEAARGYQGRNARAPSLKAGPGVLFCTKGASLNDWGAGARERRFYNVSESPRSGTQRPTQAH